MAEVALQRPIDNVSYESGADELQIRISSDRGSLNPPTVLRVPEIVEKGRRNTSEDFRDAVQYCLEGGTSPDNICQRDLDDFYEVVVAP